mgnify:CR=1 FL=1
MKVFKSLFIIGLLIICSFSEGNTAECITGGVGSSQCSHTTSGFYGLFSVTYETTCKNGFYACCTKRGATCEKELSPSDPNIRKEM